jgi:predicted  nucleic acid-binding Zn-ribbon protein
MEKVGIHKRDILVDRVVAARDSQEEAKKQFQSALERFSSVVNFHGGDLEEKYLELKDELESLEDRAREVHERIAAVEDVAEALFDEWEAELDQYSSQSLRRASERKLRETRRRYNQLIRAMKRAEAKIEPVLKPLRDEVLFLKHNLNARAIASLKTELERIETDVSVLLKDMEESIKEADAFIQTLS